MKLTAKSASGKIAHCKKWRGIKQVNSLLAQKIVKALFGKIIAQAHGLTSCPFEKQLWYGETLVYYMPKLCTLNPFYDIILNVYFEANQDG